MKSILAIAGLILLTGCSKGDYSINGTIDKSLNGRTLYVSHLTENNATSKIDSTSIKNGEFKLDLPETERQYLGFISVEGVRGNVPYIVENEKISMTIYKDSMRNSVIKGGPQNKVFTKYINHLLETNKSIGAGRLEARTAMASKDTATINSIRKAEQELVENDKNFKIMLAKNNPNSLVAAMALTDLTNLKTVPNKELKELFAELSEEVQASNLGKNVNKMITSRSATEIGAQAPTFSAPTPDGKQLALKDALGKVTILDFWASWCKPCRVENPNVVKVYNKYHDKGLNIIGISLDKESQKERWIKAIKEDQLAWQHVSNLKFWDEPIAKEYGVRAIPATFILDENGTIIAKNLRGKALEDKMAELLN